MSTQRSIIGHGIRDNYTRGKVADFYGMSQALRRLLHPAGRTHHRPFAQAHPEALQSL